MSMSPDDISLLTMIGTLISALSAAAAAITSLHLVNSWKKQTTYEGRRNAVIGWISGAALFQGTLKKVYSERVEWPKDKTTIEFVSMNFFNLVALWPAVQASLQSDSKRTAEQLWSEVFAKYNDYMKGCSTLNDLRDAVAAIYNSQEMQEAASKAC